LDEQEIIEVDVRAHPFINTDKNDGIRPWAAGMVVRLRGIILMLMSDWE